MSLTLPLLVIPRFWEECGLPGQPILKDIFEGYAVQTNVGVNAIKALWGQLVYRLCEERVLTSALEVPLLPAEGGAVVWMRNIAIVFGQAPEAVQVPNRPDISHPVMIAIGGSSGVGKTTIIKRMKLRLQDGIVTSPAFTTRPQRPSEQDGVDYHFINPDDLEKARQDPRFTNFVEARGSWYWISPSTVLESVWENPDGIHVAAFSQPQEFLAHRTLFPELKWIWLEADPEDLRQRLTDSGDRDVERSMIYNQKLAAQDRSGLIDFVVQTYANRLDDAVDRVLEYYSELERRRRS